MISRSTLLHIRLPFSWFLLPVYMMALVAVPVVNGHHALIVFIVLHIFLFTASNGFNSFYDRDTESIGGLRVPPPVTPDLLWFSLFLDVAGLALALLAGWRFFWGCVIYGMASKVYSWNVTRIKKYGFISWLFVGAGQGTGIFLLTVAAVSHPYQSLSMILRDNALPAVCAGLFLLGVFPLTQIYQHEEDGRRKDMTLSRMLGVPHTFLCAAACLVAAIGGFLYYFYAHRGLGTAGLFLALILPAVAYFITWFLGCLKDPARADFGRTMRMNFLASTGVIVFGIVVFFFKK